MEVFSHIDHFNMGFLMVKSMKALLLKVLMTLEALKKETSETTMLLDDTKNIAVSVSPMFFPFNVAKMEVSVRIS